MSPIFIETIVTAVIGLAVLVLTSLFPALKDQFDTIAPAVVTIVLFIISTILGNQLVKVWSETSIRRAEIQSETTIKIAQFAAQSLPHSHG